MRVVLPFLFTLFLAGESLAQPRVIVSIMPVHSMAAAVMGDVGTPELLLSGQNSEHTASLSPQQISDLGKADVVFMIGEGLEFKLVQISGSEAVGGKAFYALSGAAGISKLPVRKGGVFKGHGGHAHEDHAHEDAGIAFDPHLWLDPDNAIAMTLAIVAELSRIDTANAATYEANGAAFIAQLHALSRQIAAQTQAVRNRPFIVFHDAYQYFEARFGLTGAGSISDISATPPSARRLSEIRTHVQETQAVCIFREPQFDPNYVDVVREGTDAKSGVLDPMGHDITPGPQAYETLMQRLAKSLTECLGD